MTSAVRRKIGVTQTEGGGVSHTGVVGLSHTEKVAHGAYILNNILRLQRGRRSKVEGQKLKVKGRGGWGHGRWLWPLTFDL
jgi:hypothetical protein